MAPDRTQQLRALAHPLRLRILSLLTAADLTAADVARELGITHANASYHLRFLLDAGEIVVTGEEVIRGGRARRYRHPWRTEDRPQATPPSTQPGAADLVVRAATEELRRRHSARRPGAPGVVTDAELWVDAETWDRTRELLIQASSLLHDGALAPRSEGATLVNLSIFAFLMDPYGAPVPPEPAAAGPAPANRSGSGRAPSDPATDSRAGSDAAGGTR